MNNLLEKLKERKKYIEKFETKIENNKETKEKNIFSKIEEIDGRKIYYTKIFKHLIDFRVTNNRQRLRITFQNLNKIKEFYSFNLFSIKDNDKFLGIKYKRDRLKKPIFIVGNNRSYATVKTYYIEFKFKKGSIKCYIQSLYTFLRKKDKEKTEYYQFNLKFIKNMEILVYKFFNKKLPDGGIIDKWIEKNQVL